jgi:hypothetical protein
VACAVDVESEFVSDPVFRRDEVAPYSISFEYGCLLPAKRSADLCVDLRNIAQLEAHAQPRLQTEVILVHRLRKVAGVGCRATPEHDIAARGPVVGVFGRNAAELRVGLRSNEIVVGGQARIGLSRAEAHDPLAMADVVVGDVGECTANLRARAAEETHHHGNALPECVEELADREESLNVQVNGQATVILDQAEQVRMIPARLVQRWQQAKTIRPIDGRGETSEKQSIFPVIREQRIN